MFDGKAFGEEMVGVVKGYVDRATAPLIARIAELEKRQPIPGEKGDPGRDGVDGSAGRDGADGKNGRDGVAGQDGSPGRDGADGFPGKDGVSGPDGAPGKDGEKGDPGRDGSEGSAGRDGIDGKDGRDGVDGPQGKSGEAGRNGGDGAPGRDGANGKDGQPGTPGLDGAKGLDGKDGRNGIDGVGLAGALIDRAGHLVVTLSNGETRSLGPVVGADGVPGTNGTDGLDGKDGGDGVDGVGFDDLIFEHDGERGFTLQFIRGDQVKSFGFRVPVTIYRGVWREGSHEKGDAVTWAGSLWVAQKDTDTKPDSGDGWQLAVKRGRDAKDVAKI